MSIPTFTPVPHFSAEVVAGKTVSSWFTGYPFTEVERNDVTWRILHVCFAFWHEFADPVLREVDVEKLLFICEKFYPGILTFLPPYFIIYYYHFVVGKYGHLSRESGFCDFVRDKVAEYEDNPNIAFEFPQDHRPAYQLRKPHS